MRLELDEL